MKTLRIILCLLVGLGILYLFDQVGPIFGYNLISRHSLAHL